jgi:hypothetical protein
MAVSARSRPFLLMSSDVVVLIADPLRLRAIRAEPPFPDRVLYFSSANLASALESIRAHEPRVVALDTQFAHTSEGRAFLGRLEQVCPTCDAQLVVFANGRWSMQPLAATPAAVAAQEASVQIRRVPRFPVLDPLAMGVDGRPTSLIDMSVMGAQVVSTPILRPNQRLKVTLPDEGDTILTLTAHVAWSAFELAKEPRYRAGMEFTDAAAQALEQYCRRHCSDAPVPPRR